jgi:hypothetical protein
MKNLTLTITNNAVSIDVLDNSFMAGLEYGRGGGKAASFHSYSAVRERYGFKPNAQAKLLTPPENNHKLDLTEMIVYGLTLQSHIVTLLDGTKVRTCPNSGRCAAVCVLNNGNGAYPAVQRSRDAKTEHFATNPEEAVWQLGYELGKALRKHAGTLIGFRPNVNQDVDWNAILPSMSHIEGLKVYGYTKRFPINVGNQVEAYSLNETSTSEQVHNMLEAGINVAVVTNRKKGADVEQWAYKHGWDAKVVDADINDVWMLDHQGEGVIGDLTAKGKARTLGRTERRLTGTLKGSQLVGTFVQNVYA